MNLVLWGKLGTKKTSMVSKENEEDRFQRRMRKIKSELIKDENE